MQSEYGGYETPIEACDVDDKAVLAEYRGKRAEWLNWLVGEDEHAISRQLRQMGWSYITFRVINEAARLACNTNKASIVRNNTLFDFMTTGFVAIQALAIRRLDDREATRRDLQVISLRRLIADICGNEHLFTREIFVGYGGAPFDPEPGKARHWHAILEKEEYWSGVEVGAEPYATAGPDAWAFSEHAHELFDRLSGKDPSSRHRSDRVDARVFAAMDRMLNDPSIKRVRQLTNKYLAHAADPLSREKAPLKSVAPSFNEIDKAHECLFTVAGFVASSLLNETVLAAIPTQQFDVFEHAELSGLEAHQLCRLRRLANCLAMRRQKWLQKPVSKILAPSN